jgi:hypothetical protein
MAGEPNDAGADQPLRYDDGQDPRFQERWLKARDLTGDQVERAFRHGFDARDRFAERPFREVEEYLRQSWEGMDPSAPWDQVSDIVRSGYERYLGGMGAGPAALPQSEALERFPHRTQGGSTLGGVVGERPFLGAAEPVSDYEGEGGPPVEGGRRVKG